MRSWLGRGIRLGAISAVISAVAGLAQVAPVGRPGSALPTSPGAAGKRSDFNGDGFADLAIGVPGESVGGHAGAGAVNVLYGSANGLTAAHDQIWTQDSPDMRGQSQASDGFGRALATGDFNCDSYDDLAIGVPFESLGLRFSDDEGAVNILYGSANGLTSSGNQLWHQGTKGIPGEPDSDDHFGFALVSGDFNNDKCLDLAIGVPGESVGFRGEAGAVNVLYGSSAGLTRNGAQLWHQDTVTSDGPVDGEAEAGDQFGYALAAGDFNGDLFDELAIGVPYENIGPPTHRNAGAVVVLIGSADRLTARGGQLWHQGAGLKGELEDDDHFGWSLASGDFGRGPQADLAIGVPDEDVSDDEEAGAVNVVYGSSSGLSASGDQLWTQSSDGVPGGAEWHDRFGAALAAANFGNGIEADLAIGVPQEGLPDGAGAVNVLYGSGTGLRGTDAQLWHQKKPGMLDGPPGIGESLAVGNFGRSGEADIAIGGAGIGMGGTVVVIYGSLTGVTSDGNQLWSQDSIGVEGTRSAGDRFGVALAGR